MSLKKNVSGLFALSLLAACSSNPAVLQPGSTGIGTHQIQVVEDTVVLEVPMSEAESGLPYSQRRRVEAFMADYKSRGKRHGPLVLSVPQNSPFATQLEASAQETYKLAYDYGVQEMKRADYESNGSKEAPMVLAFTSYKAVAPECKSMSEVNPARMRTNDPTVAFGCATQANLAAMIAYPSDLLGAQNMDPADVIRRSTVIEKYRAGEVTATERSDAESGAISDAID